MRKVFLGVGSNIGNRVLNLNEGLSKLKSFGKVSATSFLYETAPMYESNQPSFLNAAVVLETNLSPEEVLDRCQDIELRLGRTPEIRNVWKGPRQIDIDILFYEDLVMNSERLNIPHASIQERDFVLKPLADLQSDFIHPTLGKTIEELDAHNDKSNPNLSHPKRVWNVHNTLADKEFSLDFSKETFGMGIINCTTDSFFDYAGGVSQNLINYDLLEQKSIDFCDHGYRIIDIGGESTKPGAKDIDSEIELERVLTMIERFKSDDRLRNLLISLDTRKSIVAEKGIEAGGAIINDVSGGQYDEKMVGLVAKKNVPYIITHCRGSPKTMTNLNLYSNLVEEVISELKQRIDIALNNGICKWNIFVDPGIGFSKKRQQNIEILRNIDIISKALQYPVVLGFSNKKFIGEVTGENNTVYGNSALACTAVQKGVSIIRAHDPKLYSSILFADSIYKNRKIYL